MTVETVPQLDEALAIVQRLLEEQGISVTPVYRVERVELLAFSPEGWEVAMVAVGDRSGCYMVSLPSAGVGSRPVSGGRPHTVVDLIVATLPKGGPT